MPSSAKKKDANRCVPFNLDFLNPRGKKRCLKNQGKKDQSRLPTVMAAAMALLASSSGVKATDSEQNTVPPVISAKRQSEDEHTPALVLTPPAISGTLFADHSSHSSHSSHYSSADSPDIPPTNSDTPTAPPSPTTPPSSTAPAPTPPPQLEPVIQLDSVVLNKLAQLPSLWPKQVP